ncbi:MAG TPA: cell division protein ZapE [Stellaceae bacterium]|nr:cell division protein ZapE [Stellaceae bacterium]
MPPSSQPEFSSDLAAFGGPLARYRAWHARGELLHDPAQELAAMKLQSLARALAEYQPGHGESGWRVRLGLAEAPEPAPLGLYIFGKVGRGKSMLMDMFFDCVAMAKKRRVHFYEFMQDVHARIHRRREEKGDPIAPVARDLAAEATLLCFDEFQVADIADAMILGRLFTALFAAGVVVVATSNRPPDELYKDGLQRERFVPFIELLKDRLDVLELEGARDYRLERFVGRQVFFVPADGCALGALEAAFADLTGGASGERASLVVQGRTLAVPRAAKGVAWFDFAQLCGAALGPADYLALCRNFRSFVVACIPRMGPDQRNEAKRFNMFIDTLYEAHGNLIASAEAPPAALYEAGDGAFEFERTVSRLIEMQSDDYIRRQA